MRKIASSYAKALLQLAVEQDVLERIRADIYLLQEQLTEDRTLLDILRNPTVTHDKKLPLLQSAFEEKVHPIVLKLFTVVTHKHREGLLLMIGQEFLAQYDQYQGITKAKVTTAIPLSDQLIPKLKQIAQQMVPCKEVVLEQQLDPMLIGGYVLSIKDKQLDRSLRGRLRKLEKHYMTEGY